MIEKVKKSELENKILDLLYEPFISEEVKKEKTEKVLSIYTEEKECILNTGYPLSVEFQCELLLNDKTVDLFYEVESPLNMMNKETDIHKSLFPKKNKKILDAYLNLINRMPEDLKEKELNALAFVVLRSSDFDWLGFFFEKIDDYELEKINIKPKNLISIFSYTFIDNFEYINIIREKYPSEDLDYLILSKTANKNLITLVLENVNTLDRCIELIEKIESDRATPILTNDSENVKMKVNFIISRYEKIKINNILQEKNGIDESLKKSNFVKDEIRKRI